MKKLVRIIHRDFDADAAFAGDDGVGEVVIAFDETDQMKSVRIAEPVEQLAAFAAAVCVVDDGVDLADVGVNPKSQQKHLQQRNN